MSGEKQES